MESCELQVFLPQGYPYMSQLSHRKKGGYPHLYPHAVYEIWQKGHWGTYS